MNRSARIATTVAIPLALAALLVGCSSGAATSPDDEVGGATGELGDDPSAAPEEAGDTGCVAGRTWELDIPDLASQLAIELAASDFSVVEWAGIGTHTLRFDESGTVAAEVDMTMSITVDTDTGNRITVVQTHTGIPFGEWGWRGATSTMEFSDWNDGGYNVENIMGVNGISMDSTIPIPSGSIGSSTMAVECDGSSLTTVSEGSPYVHHWTTED